MQIIYIKFAHSHVRSVDTAPLFFKFIHFSKKHKKKSKWQNRGNKLNWQRMEQAIDGGGIFMSNQQNSMSILAMILVLQKQLLD